MSSEQWSLLKRFMWIVLSYVAYKNTDLEKVCSELREDLISQEEIQIEQR